jgi:hypothetical protein
MSPAKRKDQFAPRRAARLAVVQAGQERPRISRVRVISLFRQS